MAGKSSFLDKVLGRIGRLDTEGLQTVVQRLARERDFLETLFNAIEDGVLVIRRIHVKLRLQAPETAKATVERVHGMYAMNCPLYRTLYKAIELSSSVELV